MGSISLIQMIVVGILSSAWDVREYRIPDGITFGSWGIGVLWASILGLDSVVAYLAGTVVAVATFLVPIWLLPGRLGWGDVKLAGAIGALCGPVRWIVAHTVGVGLALVVLLFLQSRGGRERPIQFAPFLSIGGVAAQIPIWSELL